MAERKRNDILEEQRRAQREFLELKKMQHGEMDAPPKPSEVAIVPKTPVEKLKNFWFHYKYAIIATVLICAVTSVMVVQCASRVNYDLEVVAFTYTAMLDEQLDSVADYMEQFCGDINGDGEVNIAVINCTASGDGNEYNSYKSTILTKLQAVMAADANALLYITDADSYTYFKNINTDESYDIFTAEPVGMNAAFYEKCSGDGILKLPDGLQLSLRNTGGAVIGKDKKVKEYFKQSQSIYTALTEGTDIAE